MSELREDPATRDWVVFATERARRPHDFRHPATRGPVPERDAACPFCPGNESGTPGEIDRLRLKDGGAAPWNVRVIPNRYPALTPGDPPRRRVRDGHFRSMTGTGKHEVIIETPSHRRAIPDLSDEEVALVFEAYQRRYRALRDLAGVEVVVLFKNHGEEAGTSLVHPHSQVIASPVEPPGARRRYQIARDYYEECGTCLYGDLRDQERAEGDRVVFATDGFVAIHPYASRWPFETWILPLRPAPSLGAVPEAELREGALACRRALGLLRAALHDPPYNLVVHTAPVADEDRPYFLWHLQIVPRLTVAAGFEMGSGMYINVALPEETAAFLRDLDAGKLPAK